ncbi:MAG: TIGR04255 family protein [Geminicoccaceae bacterium]
MSAAVRGERTRRQAAGRSIVTSYHLWSSRGCGSLYAESREGREAWAPMAQRPPDLPDFLKPPLVEVVLSVQFSKLRNYRAVSAGLLWDKIFRKSYPKVYEHPPLAPAFETFGTPSSGRAKLQISEAAGLPAPRLWFVNTDDTELIQVQADRFIHNWRKVAGLEDYPRYETIKERFFEELRGLEEFLISEDIGTIEPNQSEVTYVNHIALDQSENIWEKPEAALRTFSRIVDDGSDPAARLPRLEDVRYTARYIIDGSEGAPIGRLIITAQPALGSDRQQVLRLDLTARGAPTAPTLDAVSDFLDLGRETIVRGFTAITTPAMYQQWKRVK